MEERRDPKILDVTNWKWCFCVTNLMAERFGVMEAEV
jgi:hypothetical protein